MQNNENKKEKLLLVDVGNTQTVLGVFEDDCLLRHWRISTNKLATGDELRLKIHPLFQQAGICTSSLTGSAFACVVPKLSMSWNDALLGIVGIEPLVVNLQSSKNLFKHNFVSAAEIGADRIADAVAASKKFGCPCIVADFGTATNIEVIDKDGIFLGGIITPGLETSASALFSSATKLCDINLEAPASPIGTTTQEALQAGLIFGEADRVDGLIARIEEQLGYKLTVVATGGLSDIISKHSKRIEHVDKDITLEGIRLIYENAKPK